MFRSLVLSIVDVCCVLRCCLMLLFVEMCRSLLVLLFDVVRCCLLLYDFVVV